MLRTVSQDLESEKEELIFESRKEEEKQRRGRVHRCRMYRSNTGNTAPLVWTRHCASDAIDIIRGKRVGYTSNGEGESRGERKNYWGLAAGRKGQSDERMWGREE